jgi:hypothetical protein
MKKAVKENTREHAKENIKETVHVQPEKEAQKCHHFWVIDIANGPSSLGKCKYCGEKREFFNAFPSFNPLRKNANPLALPKMRGVEIEKESES